MTSQEKDAVVDLIGVDDAGRLYNLEVQLLPQVPYPQRALFYWTGICRSQLKRRKRYETLRPVIGIHFVDWMLFPQDPSLYLHRRRRQNRSAN